MHGKLEKKKKKSLYGICICIPLRSTVELNLGGFL